MKEVGAVFEEILAFIMGLITILLITHGFRQTLKTVLPGRDKEETENLTEKKNVNIDISALLEDTKSALSLPVSPDIKIDGKLLPDLNLDINPEEILLRKALPSINYISEQTIKERQKCSNLKPFQTSSLEPFDNSSEEKKGYMRVRNLKNLSFHDLILNQSSLIQNQLYLEEALNMARYKLEQGDCLKNNLYNIFFTDSEDKEKNEYLLKRAIELSDYLKREISLKSFISEELMELIDWVKELEANKSMEIRSLAKKLFIFEKYMIILLDVITKLEKQMEEIKVKREKIIEKWKSMDSTASCSFIS